MAHNPTNKGMVASKQPNVKRQLCPLTTTTSNVYNLTNHFSRLNPNTKSPKYPPTSSNHALSHKVVRQGKGVVLESGKEVKNVEKQGKKQEVNKQEVLVVNGVEKKRLTSDAKVELGNFWLNNSAKLVAADMPPFIQIHAVGFARKIKDSLEKFTSKTLALSLKKEFDRFYGPAWHCIVGSSFGSFVTHSSGGFLYFSLDQKLYILLFKTTVQRAD
ncbi:hypothetical protein RND81_13G124400 [Saponaria officinalis]|uniref:Dynein light chain n=1 Tax=Saponaria officinalis TaxID=3572 RepID=A0AAW1GX62_SAPOF